MPMMMPLPRLSTAAFFTIVWSEPSGNVDITQGGRDAEGRSRSESLPSCEKWRRTGRLFKRSSTPNLEKDAIHRFTSHRSCERGG